MPYLFNLKTNNKYKVTNFGFSGYGAHQMLAILENNIEQKSIDTQKPQAKVRHVFFQGILDHINRAAFADYPKFIMDDQNNLHFLQKKEDIKSTNIILEKLARSKESKIKTRISRGFS